jgi:hypothetical protein
MLDARCLMLSDSAASDRRTEDADADASDVGAKG